MRRCAPRAQTQLVVYEQELEASTISHTPANLPLFRKTKTIRSYGTGVFTVDLSALTQESVEADLVKKA